VGSEHTLHVILITSCLAIHQKEANLKWLTREVYRFFIFTDKFSDHESNPLTGKDVSLQTFFNFKRTKIRVGQSELNTKEKEERKKKEIN